MNYKKLTNGFVRGRRINDMAVRDMAVPNRAGFEEFEKRERASFQKEESQAKNMLSLKSDVVNFVDCVNEAVASGGTVKTKMNAELDKIQKKYSVICVFDPNKNIAKYPAFKCDDGAIIYNAKGNYLYFENPQGQVTESYQLVSSPYSTRKTKNGDKANFLLASQAVWDNNDVVGSFSAALNEFFNWWHYVTTPSNFTGNEPDDDDILRFSDSRRVKDNVTHEMYMCDVWVSFDEKDKEDIYNDSYISKSNGQRYTSEDYMNGDELNLEGEFQPTFDDAFDEAIQLCYKLAEKFPNDPYIINIDKFDVDDETGDVDNADSYATYNAWYNEYTGKINWV